MGCGEEAEYETLELFLLNLVLNSAIIPTSLASSGQLLFLGAGLYAASDEVGLAKASFRLLLQRMHAYLDVHTALSMECVHPYFSRVTIEALLRLLHERRHSMRLVPGGKVLTSEQIFHGLAGGEVHPQTISFDTLARWSMQAQYVRAGSGALLYQKRLPSHWLDPVSVGQFGYYKSPRSRRPAPRRPRPAPPPPIESAPALPLELPPPPQMRMRKARRHRPSIPPMPAPSMPPVPPFQPASLPPSPLPPPMRTAEPEPKPPPRPLEIILPPPTPPPTPPRAPTPPKQPCPRRRMRRPRAQMGVGCNVWSTTGRSMGLDDWYH